MTAHRLEDLLEHSGIKGMRWGVRNDDRTSSKRSKSKAESKSKLDQHPSVVKFGKNKIKEGRKMRALLDPEHIDAKTGEYTNQGKVAKTARVVDKIISGAIATGAVVGVIVSSA